MKLINAFFFKILKFFPENFIKFFSSRYIAGFTIEETLSICRELNAKGFVLTLDILGEHTTTKEESSKITDLYKNLLIKIYDNNIDANISVKPSHIGQDVNDSLFKKNLALLANQALKLSNFIRIDMEDSRYTNLSIEAYKNLSKNQNNVGIVIQSYLKKSLHDLKKLKNKNLNIRLCKGIYSESNEIAFEKKSDINKNFLDILEYAFSRKIYIGIATHDEHLLEKSYELIKKYKMKSNEFEFQALYGVPLQKWFARNQENSFKTRLYLPFGEDWYDYSMRRIKENPSIAKYVLLNIFKR
tara:strand:- start:2730 stop:3629 length:900 start_codon:yes stop_codon:yes gene_type:complete